MKADVPIEAAEHASSVVGLLFLSKLPSNSSNLIRLKVIHSQLVLRLVVP